MTTPIFPLHRGDLVARIDRVEPLGQILWAEDRHYLVRQGSTNTQSLRPRSVWWADRHLVLISIRNTPNLRLVTQAVDRAGAMLPHWQADFRHDLVALVSNGSVVARATADYIAKVPLDIVAIALEHLQATQCPAPEAVNRVLGINFKFLSSGLGSAPST